MADQQTLYWFKPLNWSEGLRAALCMFPMLLLGLLGLTDWVTPFGQASFFFSSQLLLDRTRYRLIVGLMLLGLGMAFYLVGGTVVFNFWLSLFFTFIISICFVLLAGWNFTAILAFSYFSFYTAGLNASSPEKIQTTFLAFSSALVWGSLISLPRFWKGSPLPPSSSVPVIKQVGVGLRMGVGTTIALAIGNLLSDAGYDDVEMLRSLIAKSLFTPEFINELRSYKTDLREKIRFTYGEALSPLIYDEIVRLYFPSDGLPMFMNLEDEKDIDLHIELTDLAEQAAAVDGAQSTNIQSEALAKLVEAGKIVLKPGTAGQYTIPSLGITLTDLYVGLASFKKPAEIIKG